jgi:DNA-binding IclR family transcriptional regulator
VLRAAREAGYVSTREEFTRGFSSVAAPVMAGTRPVAAISIVGPTTRILGLRRDFIVASVCRAAQRVGTLIGVVYATQH